MPISQSSRKQTCTYEAHELMIIVTLKEKCHCCSYLKSVTVKKNDKKTSQPVYLWSSFLKQSSVGKARDCWPGGGGFDMGSGGPVFYWLGRCQYNVIS